MTVLQAETGLPFLHVTELTFGTVGDRPQYSLFSATGLGVPPSGVERLPPFGISHQERSQHFETLLDLEGRFSETLARVLNETLDREFSVRSWKILFGHWLRRTLGTGINRYGAMRAAQEIIGPYGLARDTHKVLSAPTSWQSLWSHSNSQWIQQTCAQVALVALPEVMIETIRHSQAFAMEAKPRSVIRMTSRRTKDLALFLGGLAAPLTRRSKFALVSTYLSKRREVLLNLSLLQLPLLWPYIPFSLEYSEPNEAVRALIYAELLQSGGTGPLHSAMAHLVSHSLPLVYLERFNDLEDHLRLYESRLPRNPRVIFTSNRFDTDDVFKLWAMRNTERGVLYMVGQHGSNYGTNAYSNPTIEDATSDHFLTWGWSDDIQHYVKTFNFRNPKQIKVKELSNQDARVVIFHLSLSHDHETWDVAADHVLYLDFFSRFLNCLNTEVAELSEIRFYPSPGLNKFDEKKFVLSSSPVQKICPPNVHFQDILRDSDLLVFTYDSTGLLEALTTNRPVVAFWPNGLDHVKPEIRDDYQVLINAGIVHLSPESAAAHINENSQDLSTWWLSDSTQEARHAFSVKFARPCETPVRSLKALLLDAADHSDANVL